MNEIDKLSPLSVHLIMKTRRHTHGAAIPIEIHTSNNGHKPIEVPEYTMDDLGNDSLWFGLKSLTTGERWSPFGVLEYYLMQGDWWAMEVPQNEKEHKTFMLAGGETFKVVLDLRNLIPTSVLKPGQYRLEMEFDSFHGPFYDELEFEILD